MIAAVGGLGLSATLPAQAATHRQVGHAAKVTLSELDWNSSGGDNTWQMQVNKAFENLHPNVTIARTSLSFSAATNTIALRLNSPAAPCVAAVNEGWGGVGTLAKDHLVLPLNSYAKQYGWFKEYAPAVLAQQMVSSNFKTLGQGTLYEMSSALGGSQGIYYNAKLLKQLHLSVPSTLSGFEHAMSVAKKAGIVPLEIGLQDQVQITVPLYQVLDAVGNAQNISHLVYGIGNVSIAATGMAKAAAIVQQWGKEGYFSPSAAGVSSGQAENNFLSGQGLFYPGWAGYTGTASQNARTGFFVLDGKNGRPMTADNSSIAFAISSHCPTPAVAAQYLNFISSPAAAKIAVQDSLQPQIPVAVPNQAKNLIFTDQVKVSNEVARASGYVPYFDEATLTMLTTIERNGESLAAGQETPQAFVAALQSDYSAFHKG